MKPSVFHNHKKQIKQIPPEQVRYKYKFQGQERQDELHLNWDSFKWRNYDFATGRFMSIDPLAEKYPHNSTYAFSENRVIDAVELEGLEAVVGISLGGDVDYRKSHLKLLHEGALTATISNSNLQGKSSMSQFVNVLKTATENDPNGMIGFIAIWGHGTGGNVFGSGGNGKTGYLDISDLDVLRTAINNGDIVFNENAVILITACNAGTDGIVTNEDGITRMTSFAQELADITGAKVIAGRDISGDGGVSPLKEIPGIEMSYQMRNYRQGSFFQFNANQPPVDIGNTYNTSTGIIQGTTLPKNPNNNDTEQE
jgi:RHS repeat-associated protein